MYTIVSDNDYDTNQWSTFWSACIVNNQRVENDLSTAHIPEASMFCLKTTMCVGEMKMGAVHKNLVVLPWEGIDWL